ncbi:Replication protein A 70 kDa DNA-binding subunit [Corchorus olitorius]|uniref:Replication protein A 70 kDa DNA-binding subunit n=1 Tax=Corchorus olitorius TaxID=93759 RepID=A0A1R3GDA7_9ROSI|nr:Replication protein A 70 kDa DNA-binding subunit [Corchorus olitorius]
MELKESSKAAAIEELLGRLVWLMRLNEHDRGRNIVGLIRVAPTWRPPAEHSYKVNTDAAFFASRNEAGLGVTLRDWRGQVFL